MPVRIKKASNYSDWINQDFSSCSNVHSSPCSSDEVPWVESFAPRNKSDLAIHRDKIGELERALADCFKESQTHPLGGPILILSGPPGCGKTTGLRVLCTTVGGSITNNPVVRLIEWTDESSLQSGTDELDQFEQFVFMAGRYTGEFTDSHSQNRHSTVVLVKHLPLCVTDHVARFHTLLRQHRKRAQPNCLLVLTFCTNSSSRESLLPERLLCPTALRDELHARRVEFNPIAPSLVLKALGRIVASRVLLGRASGVPPRALLQHLSNECSGDLRMAINQLQFLSSSPDWTTTTEPNATCPRDTGLMIFRTLGKILYNKRESTGTVTEQSSLPSHLSHWRRNPLSFDVEESLDQCGLPGDTVIAWLFENYLHFMPRMCSGEWSSDHFSWADAQLSGGMNWRLGLSAAAAGNESSSTPDSLNSPAAGHHYGAVTVTRALLLAHDLLGMDSHLSDWVVSQTGKRNFRQFQSPSTRDAWKVAASLRDQLGKVYTQAPEDPVLLAPFWNRLISGRDRMLTEWLPYVALFPATAQHASDPHGLTSLCSFGTGRLPSRPNISAPDSKRSRFAPCESTPIETWICSRDAMAEGDQLLIEEDLSDDATLDRGR